MKAVAIGVRYSAVRRQFGPENSSVELPVIEYQLQVLIPLISLDVVIWYRSHLPWGGAAMADLSLRSSGLRPRPLFEDNPSRYDWHAEESNDEDWSRPAGNLARINSNSSSCIMTVWRSRPPWVARFTLYPHAQNHWRAGWPGMASRNVVKRVEGTDI